MEQDWRLKGQEDYLKNAVLYKVTFPAFWTKAYLEKNRFFQLVSDDAEQHVRQFPNTKEYLVGEKIQLFWHAHCDFCWATAMTNQPCEVYCTKDMNYWICKDCFEDFKRQFGWTEASSDKLF